MCASEVILSRKEKNMLKNALTYTVFTGTSGEGDVHDIFVHVPCLFFRKAGESAG